MQEFLTLIFYPKETLERLAPTLVELAFSIVEIGEAPRRGFDFARRARLRAVRFSGSGR